MIYEITIKADIEKFNLNKVRQSPLTLITYYKEFFNQLNLSKEPC